MFYINVNLAICARPTAVWGLRAPTDRGRPRLRKVGTYSSDLAGKFAHG